MCICMCMHVCVLSCLWRPDINRCLPQLLFILFLKVLNFIFVRINVLLACMYVHCMFAWCLQRALDILELEDNGFSLKRNNPKTDCEKI